MKLALTESAYAARSPLGGTIRQMNLYSEENPHSATFPFTLYPTPGLVQVSQGPAAPVRCLHTASNQQLFAVIGNIVFYVTPQFYPQPLGSIQAGRSQVFMSDNGIDLVIVDGSPAGYTVNLMSHAFETISDPAFYGGTRVDTLDTFMLFAKPGTPQFYSTLSETIAPFNPLYFANKGTYPDGLQSLVVSHDEIWLIGQDTTEVWYDAGAADFPFQRQQGVIIEYGTCAPFSVAQMIGTVFWLTLNAQGEAMVVTGAFYKAIRISTHAVEAAIASYAVISDAIGMVYQQEGHAFYVLTFPTADATWCYDQTTGLWHQRCWIDAQGVEHRHRANCMTAAYGMVLAGDWQNGAIYALNLNAYTDAGQPIKRVRTFPCISEDGKRVSYQSFIAEMEPGDGVPDTITYSHPPFIREGDAGPPVTGLIEREAIGLLPPGDGPLLREQSIPTLVVTASQPVSLRWSDTRGVTWGNRVEQSIGAAGQYAASIQWRRLGFGRNRVFELSWSFPAKTALTGAYVQLAPAET